MLRLQKSTVICAALISISLVSTVQSAQAHEIQPQLSTIQVSGSGKVAAKPDIAVLTLGVLREAVTAREALDANNDAMSDVVKAMKDEGIEERDLQTSGFNIQPRYHYPKRSTTGEQRPPRIVGYQVSNNLTIRIRDLEGVGKILDKVVTLGVNTGGQIQFSNDDTTMILEEARKKAMANAISKGKTLTSAAGVALGRILTISEHSATPRPVPIAHARTLAAQAEDASVPVQAGENQYRVDVSVTWELEQ